jgi:hypothetical protein
MSLEPTRDLTRPSTSELIGRVVRHYLTGRRGLILLGGGALVLGGIFNWGWLVAIGVAPVLLAVLPCAVMCGLGLCASRLMTSGSSKNQKAPDPSDRGGALPLQALTDDEAQNESRSKNSNCC